MKLTTMAWRNIRRNGRRTALSATAIGIAAWVVLLMFSLISGMTADMAFNLQHFYMGQIRVENADYEKNVLLNPLGLSIPDASAVEADLRATGMFSKVSGRIRFTSMVQKFGSQQADIIDTPLTGMGLEFGNDMMGIKDYLVEGRLPEANTGKPWEVVIGKQAAESMGLGVGDKFDGLVQTMRNSSNGFTCIITGIVDLPLSDINNMYYAPLSTIQRFLHMPDRAIDLLLQAAPGVHVDDAQAAAAGVLADHGLTNVKAEIWNDIPSSYIFLTIAQSAYYIMGLVFYVLAATVIINTIMMTVFERTREIGTLASMGMDDKSLVRLFFLESMFISAIGSVIGGLIGVGTSALLQHTGIDLSSAMEGVDFEISGIIYPKLTLFNSIFSIVSGIIVASLISLIPSRKAAKIKPVEAMRSY